MRFRSVALLSGAVLVLAPGAVLAQTQRQDLVSSELEANRDGAVAAAPSSAPGRMVGRPLVNQNGETLGKIDGLVRDKQDQSLKAVVVSGGILGLGERRVVVPVDRIEVPAGQAEDPVVLQSDMNSKELGQMATYQPEGFDPVAPAPQG